MPYDFSGPDGLKRGSAWDAERENFTSKSFLEENHLILSQLNNSIFEVLDFQKHVIDEKKGLIQKDALIKTFEGTFLVSTREIDSVNSEERSADLKTLVSSKVEPTNTKAKDLSDIPGTIACDEEDARHLENGGRINFDGQRMTRAQAIDATHKALAGIVVDLDKTTIAGQSIPRTKTTLQR